MNTQPISKGTKYSMTIYNSAGEAQPTPKGKASTCTHAQLVKNLKGDPKADSILHDLYMWGEATYPAKDGKLVFKMTHGTHFIG
jgi:hypothetical protein